MIAYATMYGNTENAANVLATMLADKGVKNIAMYDVSETDVSELVAESFRCSHIVLAAPTYNGGVQPKMEAYLSDIKALALQNRTVAIIDNGTWAPTAGQADARGHRHHEEHDGSRKPDHHQVRPRGKSACVPRCAG